MGSTANGQHIDHAEISDRVAVSPDAESVSRSPDRHASREDAGAQYGYRAQFSVAQDLPELQRLVSQEIGSLGFSDYSFVRLSASGQLETPILNTISRTFLARYEEKKLYEHDPMVDYVRSSDRPIFRSTLDRYVEGAPFTNEMTRATRAIVELCKSSAYYDFYYIPHQADNGSGKALLSIADRGCSPTKLKCKVESCESTLLLICEALDWVTAGQFHRVSLREEENPVAINPRPLLVLETLAKHDLNISQVADLLCISVVTANKHLETARRAFGVKTNYAAIRQAVVQGHIRYDS